MSDYRKRYNPIYKLWELEQERPSGIVEGSFTWQIVASRETEAEIDTELERLSEPPRKGSK